ncbi:MAG: hypothetical protein ABSE40_17515 [Candidatus Sulfotelmatobacter sp.]|jgi:hypothetical protein
MTYTNAMFPGCDSLTIQFIGSGNTRSASLSKAVRLLNEGVATLVSDSPSSDGLLITYNVGENAGQTVYVSKQVAEQAIAAGTAVAA